MAYFFAEHWSYSYGKEFVRFRPQLSRRQTPPYEGCSPK